MEKKNYSAPAAEIKELASDIVLASPTDDNGSGFGPLITFETFKKDTPKTKW